jgi:hypothetical protein
MILARLRDYPLCWAKIGDVVVFASTETAIRTAWKATYGKSFRSKVHSMVPGELLRINGKVVTTAGVPGVFGVEEDRVYYRPIQTTFDDSPYDLMAAGRAASKGRSRRSRRGGTRKGAPLANYVPFDRCTTQAEEKLRAAAIRRGSQATHSEVLALLDALDQAREEIDEADAVLAELSVGGSELDWTERDYDYSPARWAQ